MNEREGALKEALGVVAARDPQAHESCVEELAFLVNVVLADAAARGETSNPAAALRAVSRRVEIAALEDPPPGAEAAVDTIATALTTWGPIGLFRRRIHESR